LSWLFYGNVAQKNEFCFNSLVWAGQAPAGLWASSGKKERELLTLVIFWIHQALSFFGYTKDFIPWIHPQLEWQILLGLRHVIHHFYELFILISTM